jgi:hypothetical protein
LKVILRLKFEKLKKEKVDITQCKEMEEEFKINRLN